MIGVCRLKVRIHPLTAVLFTICFFMGRGRLLVFTYVIMTLHEAAHLVSALCIGLKAESITLAPFGVQLKLKNKIVNSLAEEIILYSSGPLMNGIMAAMGLIIKNDEIYKLNMSLFIVNLIPVYPLDGGMIIKRVLSYRVGSEYAETIIKTISVLVIITIAAFTAATWYFGEFNMSLIIMTLFLIGNILTSSEKYDGIFINGISCKRKKSNRVKMVIVDENNSMVKAARSISPSFTTVAAVTDNDGCIKELVSEKEMIERITHD